MVCPQPASTLRNKAQRRDVNTRPCSPSGEARESDIGRAGPGQPMIDGDGPGYGERVGGERQRGADPDLPGAPEPSPSVSGSPSGGVSRSGGSRSSGSRPSAARRRAEDAAARAHVGSVLAERWEVGGRIGSGGMASVHRGLDRRLERPVAVKILHPHIAESAEARERLAREARAIAQLRHENVIEVYDFDISDPELTWLVTELVEGTTLRRLIERSGPVLPEVGALITLELARALRAAHARGIVHRDVKPDNVLVGADGRPKLSDFGIAKVMAEAGMTATGNLVGSPSYMSPEQADGQAVDERTDLFSLGVVLYRLVTGVLPFRGATPLETVRKVAVAAYPDPTEVVPDCAGAVARVIRRCLARDPDQRYPSAEALITELTCLVEDAGVGRAAELLPRFFDDPAGCARELRPRIAEQLETRGRALLDRGEEARGLDCLARAAALSEGEQRTTDLIRQLRLHRRRPGRRAALAGLLASLSIVVAVAGAWWALGATELPAPTAAPASGGLARVATETGSTGGDGERARGGDQAATTEVRAAANRAPAAEVSERTTEATPARPAAADRARGEADASEDGRAAAGGRGRGEAPAAADRRAADASDGRGAAPASPARATARPSSEARRDRPRRRTTAPAARAPVRAAPTAPAPGVLHVGTGMWVDIHVDGERLGRAPNRSRYPLPPGEHVLEAKKPGSRCAPFRRTVQIRSEATTRVRVRLSCP